MGQLVELPIPSLFNGVSRQPHTVRLHNQVEEADNALFSVVTGGFEKRPGTTKVAKITLDVSTATWNIHCADRDVNERFFYCIDDSGNVKVFDADDGSAKTVNSYSAAIQTYLTTTNPSEDLVMVTVEDYTFVVNRTKTVALLAADSSDYVGSVEAFEKLPKIIQYPKVGDAWRVNLAAVQSDDEYYEWFEIGDAGTQYPDRNGVNQYIGGTGTGVYDWLKVYTGAGFPANYKIVGESRDTTDLPPAMPADPNDGDIWKIANEETADDDYYVKWDNTAQKWITTADPFDQNAFDPATMPHAIVRETNGTFTVQTLTWNPRATGDDVLVPAPKFVGREIQDIFFHKNRLGVISGQWTTLSQSGDFFNFWPEKATQAVDSDPVDRSAGGNSAVELKFAIPFRKSLFLTSDAAQFELSSENYLTPKDASVDLATSYKSSSKCRPVTMGDELYFTATAQNRSVLFEYFYDDTSISNTAADVTKHIGIYLTPEVLKMTADSTSGTLWAYSSGAPSGLYVYTTYWDGDQKVQSAWAWWELNVDSILEAKFLGSHLYLMTIRQGLVFIEKVSPVGEAALPGLPCNILLDCRDELTGSYDSGTGLTTWTLPFKHESRAQIVLSGSFTGQPGRKLTLTYDADPYTVTALGDYSAAAVYAGLPYTMQVELSKLYVRDENNNAILGGRTQIKRLYLSYANTAFFKVLVTPKARTAKTYTMTGRILGSSSNVVGGLSVEDGVFSVPVKTRGSTGTITVVNDSPYPSVITSGRGLGFFNEISKQDKRNG